MHLDRQSSSLPIKHIIEPARESISYIDGRRKGLIKSLKTPWKKYNQVSMQGIEWNSIHSVAGASGSGKTAFLGMLETGLAELNPNEQFDILSFTFEMLAKNIVTRKISSKLGKSTQELYSCLDEKTKLSDIDYNSAVEIAREVAKLNIYYVDIPGTVNQIVKTIEEFISSRPDKGVVVLLDHTILVKGEKGELERIILVDLMAAFNELKKKHKICFVILSQLNRSIESAERFSEPSMHFPVKADIFGGDSVYQFSDVVTVIMNPEQMGHRAYGPRSLPVEGRLYLHILKVREGAPCIAMMQNKLKYNMILDYELK